MDDPYRSLGFVRPRSVCDVPAVTRNGEQITSHVNEDLMAEVHKARREWERNADPMQGTARVMLGDLSWS